MRAADRWLTMACLALSAACSAEPAGVPSGMPSRSVSQGGAQDVGQFRKVVGAGGVPSGDLLDDVGFFNEHALDLPPATCGDPICFHPMLAVAPRFNEDNWTMAYVALNTAVDPRTLPVAPRHLIVVVERSPAAAYTIADHALTAALEPSLTKDDLFTLIVADSLPRIQALYRPPHELRAQRIDQASRTENIKVDLYGALTLAHEAATAGPAAGRSQQILLLTSGDTSGGIQQPSAFAGLAHTLAEAGVVISAFGMGAEYRREVPRLLTDITAGNHYFASGPQDLTDALKVAGQTGFVPLARRLRLEITAAPGYKVGAIYGAARAVRSGAENSAVLEAPALYVGARTGATDVTTGRRGGGGGFFVELLPATKPGRMPITPAPAFSLAASYLDPHSGSMKARSFTLETPLGVGNNPEPTAPFFSDPGRGKPFMMLNMYLALRTAVALYQSQDCGRAAGVEEMMRQSYMLWSALYKDPDIDADFDLLVQLSAAIKNGCRAPVARPVEVPMSCFFL